MIWPMSICTIKDCDRSVRCRGLCGMHYARLRAHGDANYQPRRISRKSQIFWTHVIVDPAGSECWLWTYVVSARGYGMYRGNHAHRFAYEDVIGEIPTGLHLDHLCRTPLCVNPFHLDPVTPAENTRREQIANQRGHAATHCKRGHEFTPENTIYRLGERKRRCRACTLTASNRRARLAQAA